MTLRLLAGVLALTTWCSPLQAQAVPFDGCGVLIQGVECILFQADSGGLYVTTIGAFQVGDEVRVIGDIDPGCITICQQGDGCIFGTIEACNPEPAVLFVRGDVNADGSVDIADPVQLLTSLFTPGADPPGCNRAADANNDQSTDISDAVFLLSSLFTMGSPPSSPYPDCGDDPLSTLSCESFDICL